MDEKAMVALNSLSKAKLNAAFQKKYAKRAAEMKAAGIAVAAEPPGAGFFDGIVAKWRAYYPTLVSILGVAAMFPWFGAQVLAIRSLLGVINDNIIPLLDEID